MKRVLMFFLFFACLGCSATRRIERIAERNGLASVQLVTVRDTVVLPQRDTFCALPLRPAGFGAERFALTTKKLNINGDIVGDTVYLYVREKADTVYMEKQMETKSVVIRPQERRSGLDYVFFFALLAIMVIVSYICLKIRLYER